MPTVRLALVADDPLARAGLALLLGSEDGVVVVSQLSSKDILADLDEDELDPVDAIVWDVGWDAQRAVSEWTSFAEPIVALLPEDCDPELFWEEGATALLRRSAPVGQIVAAVYASLENLHTFDPGLLPQASTGPVLFGDSAAPPDLTPREREVLHLLAEGLTNKAIAQTLDISSHTVKFHVTAIMTKLNAQSRTEAVVRATRFGLLSL